MSEITQHIEKDHH